MQNAECRMKNEENKKAFLNSAFSILRSAFCVLRSAFNKKDPLAEVLPLDAVEFLPNCA